MNKQLYQFLLQSIENGGLSNDDLVLAFYKLFTKIADYHENDFLFNNILEDIQAEQGALHLENASIKVAKNNEIALTFNEHQSDFGLQAAKNDSCNPTFIMYQMGLLLSSFALKLNFKKEDDFNLFVNKQGEWQSLNERLHPGILHVIERMTALNADERLQDFNEAADLLLNFKLIKTDTQWKEVLLQQDKIKWLKNKLLDISKRNKMLYFKETSSFFNLTAASFQDSGNPFYFNTETENQVKKKKAFRLEGILNNKYWQNYAAIINKIRLQSQRDIKEFGFSQLKLAPVFIHWQNPLENPDETIVSPLCFFDVTLRKKNAAFADFDLMIDESIAEINPVIQHLFMQLFNVQLPNEIDLEMQSLQEFVEQFQAQLRLKNQQIVVQLQHHIDNIQWEKQHQSQLEKLRIIPKESGSFETQGHSALSKFWKIDFSTMILGNFNSKKMSLVHDYDEIIDKKLSSKAFDALINNEIKPIFEQPALQWDWKNNHKIIAADPSQQMAVEWAKQGKSYVIQGPPGTGKSQTIANLIAEFVAQGKKVLFVCEKRAALDVVYQRLTQEGLADLCSLIHDSQVDKKAFIAQLKLQYETLLKQQLQKDAIEKKRDESIQNLQNALAKMQAFVEQTQSPNSYGIAGNFMEVLVQYPHDVPPELTKNNFREFPNYAHIEKNSALIETIEQMFNDEQHVSSFKLHPLNLLLHKDPKDYQSIDFKAQLTQMLKVVEQLEAESDTLFFPDTYTESLQTLFEKTSELNELLFFFENDLIELLQGSSLQFQTFFAHYSALKKLEKTKDEWELKNQHWQSKFSKEESEKALQIFKENENKLFRFFNKDYRLTRKALLQHYTIEAHKIKPSYSEIIQALLSEYEVNDTIEAKQKIIQTHYLKDADEVMKLCQKWQATPNADEIEYLTENKNQLSDISRFISDFHLFIENNKAFDCLSSPDFAKLQHDLEYLYNNAFQLHRFEQIVQTIANTNQEFFALLKHKNWTLTQLKTALAFVSYQTVLKEKPQWAAQNFDSINTLKNETEKHYTDLMHYNSLLINAHQQKVACEQIRLSDLSTAGYTDAEKEEKKNITEGRKILENEFNKTRRYHSIRHLHKELSGPILRNLKPVWLMSPLSVSDTLDLGHSFFDVLIFDEASQITLEEAVPALLRADQCIVVGDKMQMPPGNFFQKNQDDLYDENDDLLDWVQTESLLEQADKTLPDISLLWHYRSRYEELIAFNNAAFYKNNLQSIPSTTDFNQTQKAIEVQNEADTAFVYKQIFETPISFHYHKAGVFENRTNKEEAKYIAALVKHHLLSKNQMSIGIVAFSMEQQLLIEKELQGINFFDKSIEDLLEADNEEESIFIKNLENVQGDERDIIIISTCYGYNKDGKMRMNFGPINRKGGEKRLNVIFSRAKKHVVLVSSIKHTDIKNTYNTGASIFKAYLNYAELISLGKQEEAMQVVRYFSNENQSKNSFEHPLVNTLAHHVRGQGYFPEKWLGKSGVKCHLAIKKNKDDKQYALGILIDDAHFYSNDLLNEWVLKPRVLQAFNWPILRFFTKDWIDNKEAVMQQIASYIEGKQPAKTIKEGEPKAAVFVKETEAHLSFYRLERKDDNPKFWELALDKQNLIIQYGKIGSEGTRLIKEYASPAEAIKNKRKLIEQKMKQGYVVN